MVPQSFPDQYSFLLLLLALLSLLQRIQHSTELVEVDLVALLVLDLCGMDSVATRPWLPRETRGLSYGHVDDVEATRAREDPAKFSAPRRGPRTRR